MSTPPAVMVNGREQAGVPATDRGLHFGDGVFETIAVIKGRPALLDAHLARLARGAARLGLPAPDSGMLEREARAFAARAEDRGVLKIIVTRGSGGRGYAAPEAPESNRIMLLGPWRGRPPEEYQLGATVRWCETRLAVSPALAGIKHLNRLEQVLARSEWRDPAVAEGLMLDTDGYVVEGTASNLFIVEDDVVLTPDLSRCGVAGIMRDHVVAAAARAGIAAEQAALRPPRVTGAREVFLTSSLLGILPVGRLDGRTLEVGPMARRLMEILDADD